MTKTGGARERSRRIALLFDNDVVVVSALFLAVLLLMLFGIRPPLWVSFVAAIGFVVLVYFVRILVLPLLGKKVTGREGMTGQQGKVVEPLRPVGTVLVEGGRWNAKSTGPDIEAGEEIEVAEVRGLTLTVKRSTRSD